MSDTAEITEEMIKAGVEVLEKWKYDTDPSDQREAAIEFIRAVSAVASQPQ